MKARDPQRTREKLQTKRLVASKQRSLSVKQANGFSPLRRCLVTTLPKYCGVIDDVASIVADYAEGLRYPKFPPLPNDYAPSKTSMMAAAKSGDLQQLQYLIEIKRQSPNGTSSGTRPLHSAIFDGRTLCAQYLLFRGASPELTTPDGETALHVAIKLNKFDLADYLLSHHNHCSNRSLRLCDLVDRLHQNALHLCVIKGQLPLLTRLISEFRMDPCSPVIIPRNPSKIVTTTLHNAAMLGRIDVVKYLVRDLGVHPRITDGEGKRPGDLARPAHKAIASFLSDFKVVSDSSTYGPFHGEVSLSGDKFTNKLNQYATDGDLSALTALLGTGTAHRKDLTAAAECAVRAGHVDCMNYLIERGAIVDSVPHTLLEVALEHGQVEISESLLTHHNDLRPFRGAYYERLCDIPCGAFTSVHYAAAGGVLPSIVRLIEVFKLDPEDSANEARQTPLHFAVAANHLPIVRYLVEERGVDRSPFDSQLRTPLSLAIHCRLRTMEEYLRGKGAV